MALRWLAGGSYLDLSFGYNLPDIMIHTYVFKVLNLINQTVRIVRFPIDDEVALQKLLEEFNQFTNGHFSGTVAAGDGIVFMMERGNWR